MDPFGDYWIVVAPALVVLVLAGVWLQSTGRLRTRGQKAALAGGVVAVGVLVGLLAARL